MRAELETEVLKGVSRSFYLSLRLLPGPMRRAAGIAYLLARTSDTIADSVVGSAEERIESLLDFLKQVNGEIAAQAFPEHLYAGITDPREAMLLLSHMEILQALRELETVEISLIHEVLETIVSGQILDLERFGKAGDEPSSLKSAEELEDYAWRVAGCVGLFWTRLGFLTMGKNFSNHPQAELEQWGVEYGKGLQLVNILRDFPADRRMGRCYLPVTNPTDDESCFAEFQTWRKIALEKVAYGLAYAEKLQGRRLRLASGLPALIAEETLNRLSVRNLAALEPRVKISRNRLYLLILRQCLGF
ncbi:MAG: squalene/phytoene synthase family protein [Verrucomicrobiota bacterium]